MDFSVGRGGHSVLLPEIWCEIGSRETLCGLEADRTGSESCNMTSLVLIVAKSLGFSAIYLVNESLVKHPFVL
jgi:hypothetical protein